MSGGDIQAWNCIFHWNAHSRIMDKSLLKLFETYFCQTCKIDVSSANIPQIEIRPFGKSFTRFFYKQHFYKQRQGWNLQNIKQKLSNTLRLNFWQTCQKKLSLSVSMRLYD